MCVQFNWVLYRSKSVRYWVLYNRGGTGPLREGDLKGTVVYCASYRAEQLGLTGPLREADPKGGPRC